MGDVNGPKDVEEEIQYRMGSVPEKLMSSLYPFQVIRLVTPFASTCHVCFSLDGGTWECLEGAAGTTVFPRNRNVIDLREVYFVPRYRWRAWCSPSRGVGGSC